MKGRCKNCGYGKYSIYHLDSLIKKYGKPYHIFEEEGDEMKRSLPNSDTKGDTRENTKAFLSSVSEPSNFEESVKEYFDSIFMSPYAELATKNIVARKNEYCLDKQKVLDALNKYISYNPMNDRFDVNIIMLKKELGLDKEAKS